MKKITLKNHGYIAEILPHRGGNCIRAAYPDLKIEALRTAETETAFENGPFFFGTPLIFPPNRISGGHFVFEGRDYFLPVNEAKLGNFLHGEMHKTPFEIKKQTETEAILEYKATSDSPYLTFPHEFSVTLRYFIDENGIHQRISFRNDSKLNMPFAVGFHTTFNAHFQQGMEIGDAYLTLSTGREVDRNPESYLPTGRIFDDYPLKDALNNEGIQIKTDGISHLFEAAAPKKMVLSSKKSSATVTYSISDGYRYWMLYQLPGSDFVCAEPQTWMSNCPNAPFNREETGFDFLAPGQEKALETVITISE